jgi:hypothetical protein
MDGLDCIWLVNEDGEYEQTTDHSFLAKYFKIEVVSKEKSLYGRHRCQFPALSKNQDARTTQTPFELPREARIFPGY